MESTPRLIVPPASRARLARVARAWFVHQVQKISRLGGRPGVSHLNKPARVLVQQVHLFLHLGDGPTGSNVNTCIFFRVLETAQRFQCQHVHLFLRLGDSPTVPLPTGASFIAYLCTDSARFASKALDSVQHVHLFRRRDMLRVRKTTIKGGAKFNGCIFSCHCGVCQSARRAKMCS